MPRSYVQARQFIQSLGLQVMEGDLKQADGMFDKMNISEADANQLVMFQAALAARSFRPSTYTFGQRVFIALHFLFNVGKPK